IHMRRLAIWISGPRREAVLAFFHRWPPPRSWRDASVRFARRHRGAWPAAGIVIVSVAAYHFTLLSLFDFLRFDTSLAYLALLPPLALGIAILTAQRYSRAKPPIRDRHVDLIVGIGLLVASLVLVTLVPVLASTYYWSDRADVLYLTLFDAGAAVLCYGVN